MKKEINLNHETTVVLVVGEKRFTINLDKVSAGQESLRINKVDDFGVDAISVHPVVSNEILIY